MKKNSKNLKCQRCKVKCVYKVKDKKLFNNNYQNYLVLDNKNDQKEKYKNKCF